MKIGPGLEALELPRGVLTVPENPDRSRTDDIDGLAAFAAARSGDLELFRKLFDTHGERMKSVAYQLLCNRSDAEDAVQEAFLKAYRNAGTFRGGAAFSTWVYRILVNACHDLRRKRRSREDALEPDDSGLDRPERAAGVPRDKLRIELDRALRQIHPMSRSVFVLFEVEGFKHREIGEMLGIPEGTSKNLLFRAKRELQDLLMRRRKVLEGGVS
jgi:RNA polymerase sigma-70 factor (ECF subfamily)